MTGARDAAPNDLIAEAQERDADGAIGTDFGHEVRGEAIGMVMVAVSGTAVEMA